MSICQTNKNANKENFVELFNIKLCGNRNHGPIMQFYYVHFGKIPIYYK